MQSFSVVENREATVLSAPIVATALMAVAACGLAAGFVSGRMDSPTQYRVSLHEVEREFYSSRKLCERLSGIEWEQCITVAWSGMVQSVAKADALHRNAPESYRVQRFIAAATALLTQTQRCGALGDSPRAACDKAALEAYRGAVRNAAAPDVTGDDCTLIGCPRPRGGTGMTSRLAASARF